MNWSAVGRRSRRKGKKSECQIARMLREVTGQNWQTVRNSGRTDLAGDVYCLDAEYGGLVIECKNRKHWHLMARLRSQSKYVKELKQVRADFLRRCEGRGVLALFVKDSEGWWLAASTDNLTGARCVFYDDTAEGVWARGRDGEIWHYLNTEVLRGFFRWLSGVGVRAQLRKVGGPPEGGSSED